MFSFAWQDLDSILKEYGMDEKEIVKAQELELRKLDPEVRLIVTTSS